MMSKFAKVINLKNAKAITKKEKNIFINFHQLIYLLHSISCQDLEPLAVKFSMSKFAKGNN